MAFIVKKKIHGREYYYLNENKRVDGKVKTKTISYLGKIERDAKKKAKEIIKEMKRGKIKKRRSDKKNTERKSVGGIKLKGIFVEGKKDKIFSIASTRGFFYNTASIYGGKAGFFTFGHLGKSLKNNWENLWRKYYLGLGDNFVEIQSNSILPEKVFVASGHLENFNDALTECEKCHLRFRADQFLEDAGVKDAEALPLDEMTKRISEKGLKCNKCGGNFTDVKQFNMMFPVSVGFEGSKAYLSPETAQGAYLTFKEEFLARRSKLPLGISIIDKVYRNEISPRQGFFRLREFTQAELQIFFDPDKINEHENWEEVKKEKLLIKFAGKEEVKEINCEELNKKGLPKFYVYYAAKVQKFYLNLIGVPKEKFRFRELSESERAFYNKIHFDVELVFDTLGGFKEVGGIHYRTDHDLQGHKKVSKENLEISFDGKKFIPHVLELSFGVDRNVYSLLDLFIVQGKEGFMFKFPPKLAPIKAAVFPIIKKPKFEKIAEDIVGVLRDEWNVVYDKSGSIGRRYARNDEIGTPMCITVDEKSPKDKTVTIRWRDNAEQIRIKIKDLKEIMREVIKGENIFSFGKLVDTRKKV